MMPRIRLAIVAAWLMMPSLGSSFAQGPSQSPSQPPQQSVESLLASGDPRLVAWGAHNALAANRRDLIPELLSLAAQWQPIVRENPDAWNAEDDLPQDDLDRRDAMQAVLDTLIQMKVTVPPDVMRTLAPEFGNDVAVLLSRIPQEEAIPLAVEFYQAESKLGSLGYLSAAMLALHPQPGFAADMLRSTDVYATILVVRPGERESFAHGGGDCFEGSGDTRKDWPRTGQYIVRLGEGGVPRDSDSMVLLEGVDTIYAKREEATNYHAALCGRGIGLSRESRRRLIAEMLRLAPEKMPWETELQPNVEFLSLEQFYTEVRHLVAEEQAKYRLTVAGLLHRNLMTQSEAQTDLPHLILNIQDDRQDGNAPALSKPPGLPANVDWRP
jgi:hypothetical protein